MLCYHVIIIRWCVNILAYAPVLTSFPASCQDFLTTVFIAWTTWLMQDNLHLKNNGITFNTNYNMPKPGDSLKSHSCFTNIFCSNLSANILPQICWRHIYYTAESYIPIGSLYQQHTCEILYTYLTSHHLEIWYFPKCLKIKCMHKQIVDTRPFLRFFKQAWESNSDVQLSSTTVTDSISQKLTN